MNIRLQKAIDNSLRAIDEESMDYITKLKLGQIIHFNVKKERNYVFHQKWFVLVKFAYSHWEPGELQDSRFKGVIPEKSFERFRKDITILAGYYDAFYRIDGSSRIEAKSISFGSMKAEEFEKLYSNTIDVVLQHILTNYDKKELERVVSELLGFT